jgi:hypothetical protein
MNYSSVIFNHVIGYVISNNDTEILEFYQNNNVVVFHSYVLAKTRDSYACNLYIQNI